MPDGTDQADLFALLEGCGGFDEEDLVADLLGDVIETDHWGLKGGNRWPLLFHVGRRGKLNRDRIGLMRTRTKGDPRRRFCAFRVILPRDTARPGTPGPKLKWGIA